MTVRRGQPGPSWTRAGANAVPPRVHHRPRQPTAGRDEHDVRRLLDELEMHQLELKARNDELHAAHAAARRAASRSNALFDFAPMGYATLTCDGTILAINFAAAKVLGHARDQLAGRRFGAFVSERDRTPFDEFLAAAFGRTAGGWSSDLGLESTAAEPVYVRLLASELPGFEHEVLLAIDDVSERRKLEEERRAGALIAELDRRKDEFLAMLSHELRNPLAPIRNASHLLRKGGPGSELARHAQAVIERQTEHLARIVDEILDVARVTRGKIDLRRSRLDLREVVIAAAEDHRAELEGRGVAFHLMVPPTGSFADADATRVTQVVGNLLHNAAKATRAGDEVVLSLREVEGSAEITVRDTGAGIDQTLLPHVFQPFVQGERTLARTEGGLGLGLALVKSIAELHGGGVRAESAGAGRGAEFVVRLPLSPEPPCAPVAALERDSARPCSVLIIEDNVDAAETLAVALELEGNDVRRAHDGESGIALARSFAPQVVLCDIGLPDIDGYQVGRALRSDPALRHTRLVAVTGYARPEDRQRALEAGFDLHIAKPASIQELLGVVAASTSGRPTCAGTRER